MCSQLNYLLTKLDFLIDKYKRQKRLDGEHLFHSEWNRRLGACSVAAISGTMTLSLTFYVVLPKLLASFANRMVLPLSPPFAAFALAFVIFFLAGNISNVLYIRADSKSCLLYNFAYSTHSEAFAFVVGWSQLMDWLAILTVLVHNISDSVNLLFHNIIEDNLKMDWLSLRVLITISVVFLISALFTVTSTTVVALLHNIAHLRVNYLDVPESFDELFNSCCFFLLGFLAIESLSFLADETEQPGKVIRQFLSVQISFTEDTVLPVVFNSISIFSARYLMNVGSICGLASAVLCAYLPTTRIVCALAEDRLLPFQSSKCKLNRLHGKGGSPRLAVLTTVFIVCLLVVLVPKPLMVQLIPLNLCFRLFSLAFLVFKSNFASEKSSQFVTQSLPAKYNRMRHCGVSSMTNSNSAASSSDVEDGRSEFSSNGDIDDEGMRLFEQMCQLTNLTNCHDCNYGAIGEPTESSGLLVPPSGISNNNMPQHYCATSQNRHLPRVHNCLTSPCASSLQISAASAGGVGPEYYQNAYSCTSPHGDTFADAESAEKIAHKLLTSFVILTVLVAISHKILRETKELKTEDDYGFAANNVSSTPPEETRKRSRWQSVGCLLSMFLLIQLLFQFPLIKYMLVVGWICLGFVMYSISVCKKKV
uniref:Uncharacterized protein n=1 Tax=Ditylenchus dipsaci TaxID=166011 RepID=A0A915D6S7_9BILA